jgi:hypothetical protein
MEICKDFLYSFDNIKDHYADKKDELSKEHAVVTNQLFAKIRFIFTRFGRIISIYEPIHQRHKIKSFNVDI